MKRFLLAVAVLVVGNVFTVAGQPQLDPGAVQIIWIDDNPEQTSCPRLVVNLSAYDYIASTSLDCSQRPSGGFVPFVPLSPNGISLEADEARALMGILESPAFWNGGVMGEAAKTDGTLQRLDISSGRKRAMIVTSGNPSFNEPGLRRDFLGQLQKIKDRLGKLEAKSASAKAVTGQARASDGLEVTLINETTWGGPCRLALALGTGTEKVSVDCSSPSDERGYVPFAPLSANATVTRQLTTEEATRLRALLRNPELATGSIVGDDSRHRDGSFTRLETRSGDQRGIVVVSGNSSFRSGFRSDLLNQLFSVQDQMRQAALAIANRAPR